MGRFGLVDYDSVATAKNAAKATNVRIDGRVVRIEFASDAEAAPRKGPVKLKGGPRAATPAAPVADEERRARQAFGEDDDDDDDDKAAGGATYEDRTARKGKRVAPPAKKAVAADPYEGLATYNTESSSASTMARPRRPAGAAPNKRTKFDDDA
jgi:hypothetical protein